MKICFVTINNECLIAVYIFETNGHIVHQKIFRTFDFMMIIEIVVI
jgi:hypothetical protein